MNRIAKNRENGLTGSTEKKTRNEFDVIIDNLKVPSGKSKEQVWQAILEKLEESPAARTIPLIQVALRIAASLAILIAIGGSVWVWGYGKVDVYCPKGQHITQLLPDSSKIQINADTRISYNKVLWFTSRKIYIKGEALFKVKKGKQFDVVADLATTSVLGTTFNVYARDGKVKVSCIEGRVSVKNNESDSKVILTAGLHTQTVKKELTKPVEMIKHEELTWPYGEFYFNNTPLIDVFKEIERQFNVDVIFKSTKKRFYTGYFKNNDLNEALRLVCIPMGVSYTVNERSIEIKQIE
ncbi:MAG: FecR domain-containing protein [Bacteroidales bacterium]|nr:FecR domain-containing protein [Bacteroidales bacterium]